MRLERRTFPDGTYLVLGIVESTQESELLDGLSAGTPGAPADQNREVFARGDYEVRLSDGFGSHYVLLRRDTGEVR